MQLHLTPPPLLGFSVKHGEGFGRAPVRDDALAGPLESISRAAGARKRPGDGGRGRQGDMAMLTYRSEVLDKGLRSTGQGVAQGPSPYVFVTHLPLRPPASSLMCGLLSLPRRSLCWARGPGMINLICKHAAARTL